MGLDVMTRGLFWLCLSRRYDRCERGVNLVDWAEIRGRVTRPSWRVLLSDGGSGRCTYA